MIMMMVSRWCHRWTSAVSRWWCWNRSRKSSGDGSNQESGSASGPPHIRFSCISKYIVSRYNSLWSSSFQKCCYHFFTVNEFNKLHLVVKILPGTESWRNNFRHFLTKMGKICLILTCMKVLKSVYKTFTCLLHHKLCPSKTTCVCLVHKPLILYLNNVPQHVSLNVTYFAGT